MSDGDFKSAGGTGWIAAPLVAVILASAFARGMSSGPYNGPYPCPVSSVTITIDSRRSIARHQPAAIEVERVHFVESFS